MSTHRGPALLIASVLFVSAPAFAQETLAANQRKYGVDPSTSLASRIGSPPAGVIAQFKADIANIDSTWDVA